MFQSFEDISVIKCNTNYVRIKMSSFGNVGRSV